MSEIQVASRYAKSLIDLAEEQGSLEAVKADIDKFIKIVHGSSQLQAVLKNPIINPDKKLSILNQLFEDLNKLILAFFKIVVNKGRAGALYATAKEFVNEYDRRKGTVRATITSASALSEANKAQVTQVVQQLTKGAVELETQIDPSLIGGFILKIGDKRIDTSILSSLNRLKKEFNGKA